MQQEVEDGEVQRKPILFKILGCVLYTPAAVLYSTSQITLPGMKKDDLNDLKPVFLMPKSVCSFICIIQMNVDISGNIYI